MTKAEIQLVRSLADKRARTEHGLFVAEGDKLVGEIIDNPKWHIERLFVTEDSKVLSSQAEVVSQKDMERLSALKSAPRSLALVRIPERKAFVPNAQELVIALDEVQDPGNLGTIIRTADWYGIRHIVCSTTTADCFSPKVVQATMGALLRVEVTYCNLSEWLRTARKSGVPTYATTLDGKDIHTAPLTAGGIIIMGNEGAGVKEELLNLADQYLYIDMNEKCESLNVGVATSIILYELDRRD